MQTKSLVIWPGISCIQEYIIHAENFEKSIQQAVFCGTGNRDSDSLVHRFYLSSGKPLSVVCRSGTGGLYPGGAVDRK